jgi:hypothetical protein
MQRSKMIMWPVIFLTLSVFWNCGGGSSEGETQGAFVSGVVFEDANTNGIMDFAEDPLAGVVIMADCSGSVMQSVTDISGFYRVMASRAGTCLVTEEDPLDYVSTNAIPGSGGWKVDSNTLGIVILEADLDYGTEFTGYDFGDYDLAGAPALWIEGSVWIDSNGSGTHDAGEGPLEGATVSLSTGPQRVTGPDGLFMIFAPPSPSIIVTVQVTHPAGYVPTNAIPGPGGTRHNSTTIVVQGSLVPLDVPLDVYISYGNQFGAVVP